MKNAKDTTFLTQAQYKELYAYLSPLGSDCARTLTLTIRWMKEHDIKDVRANIEKLVDLGAHCDCEVLLNTTPRRWTKKVKSTEIDAYNWLNEREFREFVDGLMIDSLQPSLWEETA